jgi:hypothetical protein
MSSKLMIVLTTIGTVGCSVASGAWAAPHHGVEEARHFSGSNASAVPTLNVEPSCRAAGDEFMILGRTTESCLNDENSARDDLVKSWSTYSAADKSQCLPMVSTGGPPSYVELLSCLEMSRDVAVQPGLDAQ